MLPKATLLVRRSCGFDLHGLVVVPNPSCKMPGPLAKHAPEVGYDLELDRLDLGGGEVSKQDMFSGKPRCVH